MLFELGHIAQVLVATDRFFVGDEVLTTHEWHEFTIDVEFHLPRLRIININAIDSREEVDAVWWVTQLDHGVGTQKIFTGDLQ